MLKPRLGNEREKREINEKNLDMVIFPRSGFLIRQRAFIARDSLSGGGIVEKRVVAEDKLLSKKRNAILLSILAMFLWGSAIPLIKSTFTELGIGQGDAGLKILVAGIRFLLAGFLTLIYFKVSEKGRPIAFKKVNWKFVMILALIQTSLQYIFYYIGLSHVAGVKSSIIQSTNAFLVVLISQVLIPNEKVNPNILIALVLGTLGIIISNGPAENTGGIRFVGEGFVLIATTLNALASVMIRKYGKGINSFILTSFQFMIGAVVLILLGLAIAGRPLALTPKACLMILYGAFISATSFSIWTSVLQRYHANEFGVYKLFIPIFGSLLSVLVLDEAFTLNMAVGLALVLFGSFILNKKKISFGK